MGVQLRRLSGIQCKKNRVREEELGSVGERAVSLRGAAGFKGDAAISKAVPGCKDGYPEIASAVANAYRSAMADKSHGYQLAMTNRLSLRGW